MSQDEYINYPQTPWYEERQNWFFIGAGVLLVAAIIVGSILFVRHRNAARLAAVEQELIVQDVEAELNDGLEECKNSENQISCNEDKTRLAAVAAGSVEICQTLSGEAYEKCVVDVASSILDESVCNLLDKSDYCKDRVLFARAKDNNNYKLCGNINDAELHESCQGQLITYALAEMNCKDTHLTDEECVAKAVIDEAKAGLDLSICDRLSDFEKAQECKEEIEYSDTDDDDASYADEIAAGTDPRNADSDSDGLADGEELNLHGSNPLNPDTDGDGYKDGEEVRNGYSPTGEGRLWE
jgi:hypothetical protein